MSFSNLPFSHYAAFLGLLANFQRGFALPELACPSSASFRRVNSSIRATVWFAAHLHPDSDTVFLSSVPRRSIAPLLFSPFVAISGCFFTSLPGSVCGPKLSTGLSAQSRSICLPNFSALLQYSFAQIQHPCRRIRLHIFSTLALYPCAGVQHSAALVLYVEALYPAAGTILLRQCSSCHTCLPYFGTSSACERPAPCRQIII